MSPRIAGLLVGLSLALACSTTLDPTILIAAGDNAGGAPPSASMGQCAELVLQGRIFLACSTPTATFEEAQRDCRGRGGELARVSSIENNEALFALARDSSTETNLWLGGTRDEEHVWRWPDGTAFWSGLADGAPSPGVFVNWQSGEPNNDSTVTLEPERCLALALYDSGWRDRVCSLELSYFCELSALTP